MTNVIFVERRVLKAKCKDRDVGYEERPEFVTDVISLKMQRQEKELVHERCAHVI